MATVTMRKRGKDPVSFKAGGLHESTHTPADEPIPASKMRAAKAGRYGEKAVKQANMASGMLAKGRRTAAKNRKSRRR